MKLQLRRGLPGREDLKSALELVRSEIEMPLVLEGERQKLARTTVFRILEADLLEKPNSTRAVVVFRGQRGRTKEFALGFEGSYQGIMIARLCVAALRVRPFFERSKSARGLRPRFGRLIHFGCKVQFARVLEEQGRAGKIGQRASQFCGLSVPSGVLELFGGAFGLTLLLM